ncbi:hypothetical protein LTR08_006311 [Meristemomyces frigidus]|nr:hypothetical protein LTR08_006311 [Meristemomyces frigidus]
MFCTTLRRRPSFASITPALTAASGLGLRESRLDTHDISIPLVPTLNPKTGSTLAPTRQLRVLLLSLSVTASPSALDDTMKRIQHFVALTGGRDLAIVFLLSSRPPTQATALAKPLATKTEDNDDDAAAAAGVHAYVALQAALMSHSDVPNIPLLPLASSEGLAALLKKHAAVLARPRPQPIASLSTSFGLLQLCTADPPMPQQTAYVLTDVFVDLRDLAEVCTTAVSSTLDASSPSARAASLVSIVGGSQGGSCGVGEGAESRLKGLRDLVGRQQCSDVVDFWGEEWTME